MPGSNSMEIHQFVVKNLRLDQSGGPTLPASMHGQKVNDGILICCKKYIQFISLQNIANVKLWLVKHQTFFIDNIFTTGRVF